MNTKRINLWSSPRNVSTAIMYSFAQRADTKVVDEPLYAYYLQHASTKLEHPGREAILNSQSTSYADVIEQVFFGPYEQPIALFKQMTHHLQGIPFDFTQKMENVLLIRNPRRIIHSFSKVIPNPEMSDIGVKQQLELFSFLKSAGKLAAVVDTKTLLQNPASILTQLCEQLDIPFDPAMLQWEPGARPEDGVWASYWYKNVHQSTGFLPFEEKEFTLPDQLEALAAECRPYYEQLYQYALQPH
jgi:hypothetical protein